MNINVEVINKSKNSLPEYQTPESACCDVAASETVSIEPGQTVMIGTGLHLNIPQGYEVQMRARSSLGKKGLILPNGIGTIDSDYQGEIKMILFNSTEETYIVNEGDRIAQLSIHPKYTITWLPVKEFSRQTERGSQGFGSTGIK